MGGAHTSVPRWPAGDPGVDPAARSVAMLGFGPAGVAAVRRWLPQVPPGTPVTATTTGAADAAVLDELARRVAASSVGWRLMLAGPEADVLAARAVAVDGGLLDAEVRTAVTDTGRKRVFCPHCRTTTEAEVDVGAETGCSGCGRRLVVHWHVSRRSGSYLGYMADAEEVA
ncbi:MULTISPECIES: dimethylamine monooxygenase subunit DmmA family protein [unclassified Geodermatophilus]|uniref:dimethylamine monooxygenase subunit DmmA family protein n=1 Tax=unclassified Geodermatophilus TaxID=2637632 RepID=UPI003EEB67B5